MEESVEVERNLADGVLTRFSEQVSCSAACLEIVSKEDRSGYIDYKCGGCSSMIAKGVRFNAEKKQVRSYYSI
ncbi:hypothetical protein JHK82_028742 [Glycine max]|nr:hypothetical protein JHK87_028658 [Glycine soja]KAG4997967.1 hypothetical protein JHK85_029406 [Glycine max]KAG5127907.1 hypothetical protein JHK82_028742 [Glycine max]